MKRLATLTVTVLAVLVTVLLQAVPASSNPWRHHVHLAYADTGAYYGGCRIGWWQTLAYGHVRPHWTAWCR